MLYSFKLLETHESELNKLQSHFRENGAKHFNELLTEALRLIFYDNTFDPDILSHQYDWYTYLLDSQGYPELSVYSDTMQFSYSNDYKKLNNLVNDHRPLVDSSALAVFAIECCLEAANLLTEKHKACSERLLTLFRVASEAIGIGRISSYAIELALEYEYETTKDYLASRNAKRENGQIGGQAIKSRYEQELPRILSIAEYVWEHEPSIKIRVVAEEIHQYLEDYDLCKNLPSIARISRFLSKNTTNQSAFVGCERTRTLNRKFRNKEPFAVARDLIEKYHSR